MKISKTSSEQGQKLHDNQDLKPVMNQILVFTAKITWKMMKTLVKAAFLIPGMVRKLGHEKQTNSSGDPVENKRD